MSEAETPKVIRPLFVLDQMHKNAPILAIAKANRVYLEEFRKSLKAVLMQQAQAIGAKSSAEQERDAYAHPNYVTHLEGLKAAVEQEELLRWRMVKDQAAIEVWRSQESSNRAMDRGAA